MPTSNERPTFVDIADRAASEAYKDGIYSHNNAQKKRSMAEMTELDNLSIMFEESSPREVIIMAALLTDPPSQPLLASALVFDMTTPRSDETSIDEPPIPLAPRSGRLTTDEISVLNKSQKAEITRLRGLNPEFENVLYAHFENQEQNNFRMRTPQEIIDILYGKQLASIKNDKERKKSRLAKSSVISMAKLAITKAISNRDSKDSIAITEFLAWAKTQPSLSNITAEGFAGVMGIGLSTTDGPVYRRLVELGFSVGAVTENRRTILRGSTKGPKGIEFTKIPAPKIPQILPEENPQSEREILAGRILASISALASDKKLPAIAGSQQASENVLRHSIRQLRILQRDGVEAMMPELRATMDELLNGGSREKFAGILIQKAEKFLPKTSGNHELAKVVERIKRRDAEALALRSR